MGASKKAANKTKNHFVEKSSLGKINPKFTYKNNKDGSAELHKSYTEKDLVDHESTFITKKPKLNYHSRSVVKNGKVHSNSEVLTFSLNHKESNMTLAASKNSSATSQAKNNELIGSVKVDIESNFTLIGVTKNATLTNFINFYEKNTTFVQIDLSIPENKP